MNTLIITCGDVNGIGPEISLKAIEKIFNPAKRRIIFLCPGNVFEKTNSIINPKIPFKLVNSKKSIEQSSNRVFVYDFEKARIDSGKPTKYSGLYSSHAIELSYELSIQEKYSAIITSPVSKTAFEKAVIKYPGQTEFYTELSNAENSLMTFLSKKMICALQTIHEPIEKISSLLSKDSIKKTLSILLATLEKDLGIKNPTIGVLGLNPHAGEDGRIGKEELEIIIPAIRELKNRNVVGAFVPDAYFATKQYKYHDATLGMYHDQVLIPFKMLCFDKGVNYTAGLPIIRTSPDHGTAYDIADLGIANPASMIESIWWAEKIISNRKKNG